MAVLGRVAVRDGEPVAVCHAVNEAVPKVMDGRGVPLLDGESAVGVRTRLAEREAVMVRVRETVCVGAAEKLGDTVRRDSERDAEGVTLRDAERDALTVVLPVCVELGEPVRSTVNDAVTDRCDGDVVGDGNVLVTVTELVLGPTVMECVARVTARVVEGGGVCDREDESVGVATERDVD